MAYQAFVKTAGKILQNIQDGVFDVSNEVTCYSLGDPLAYIALHIFDLYYASLKPFPNHVQSSGIKVGYGRPQGQTGARDGTVSQRGACCS